MPAKKSPRLLVADDDLGVIAAYRLVLEDAQDSRAAQRLFALDALENELFGPSDDRQQFSPWRVHFVDQGLDAIAAVQSAIDDGDPFTAVFLDIRMPPGIDGYETADRIRKIDGNIHIIFVSGYSDHEPEELLDVGGGEARTTILPKPVWPDELRAVAATVIEQRTRVAG